MRRLLVPLALAAVAVFWGVAFVAIKKALEEVAPSTLVVARFTIALVILGALMVVWPAARPRIPRDAWWRILILGITGVPAYHLALNWGEQRTSASIAALIVATAPVMVAVTAPLLLRERLTARGIAGFALAFGGVALLAFQGSDGGSTDVLGFVVTLLAPVSWAVYTIVAKPLTARVPAIQITIAGMVTGTVLLLPLLSPGMVRDLSGVTAVAWWWILWLGLGATAGGYVLFNFALTHMSATRVSIAIYFVPVVALISAALLLDEPLGPMVWLAATLVITGVVLTQRGGVAPRAPAPIPAATGR